MLKAEFWNKKILGWEKRNYGNVKTFRSVNYRKDLAQKILSRKLKDQSLLDLGCGSGLLLEVLAKSTDRPLYGIDLSKEAILIGSRRTKDIDNIKLEANDICIADWPETEFVSGFGILDWLTNDEIRIVAEKIKKKKFIFSFSEKTPSLQRILHKIYVFLLYGWKNTQYIPRYYKKCEIDSFFCTTSTQLYYYRNSKLAFGALVSNFPIDEDRVLYDSF